MPAGSPSWAGGRAVNAGVRRPRRRALAALAGLLGGCALPGRSAPRPVVRGQVTFAPAELPAGAQLEVTLEDTARADAPSVRIASVRIDDPRPGVEYSFAYDPVAVPGHARLSVRARITQGGRLLHTTDRHHPVQPGVATSRVDLSLLRVSGGR